MGPDWAIVDGPPAKKKGELLVLDAKRAVDLGVARTTLQARELQGVFTVYGISESDVTILRASWLDNLVFFLQHPATTTLAGNHRLYLHHSRAEGPGPNGAGDHRRRSASCSSSGPIPGSPGKSTPWRSLLLLLGLVLLAVELFVLPGFGVTGLAGIVLILLSLSLVVVKQWPQTSDEYMVLGRNFGIFTGGLIFSVLGAIAIARFLPHIPFANKLMLPTPDDEHEALDAAAGQLPCPARRRRYRRYRAAACGPGLLRR